MTNDFYTKEDYIERCKTQIEAYKLLLRGIKMLKSELPSEDEKTFNAKNLEALNSYFAGKLFFHFSDEWETRYLHVTTQEIKFNCVNHDIRFGQKDLFKGGKIHGLPQLCIEITNTINRFYDEVDQYENAVMESNIRLFQSRYKAFYKAYEELKRMDMPMIYIDYLSEKCPIR